MPPAAIGPPRKWMRTWRAIWKGSGCARGNRARSFGPRRRLCYSFPARLFGVPCYCAHPPSAHVLVPFDAGVPNAMQPALSRDGKWLAFASPGKDGTHPDIWLKPMPNGAAKRVTGGEAANDEPSLSPDGHWLAFHSARQPAGIYLQPAAPSGRWRPRATAGGGRPGPALFARWQVDRLSERQRGRAGTSSRPI